MSTLVTLVIIMFMFSLFVNIHISICGGYVFAYITLLQYVGIPSCMICLWTFILLFDVAFSPHCLHSFVLFVYIAYNAYNHVATPSCLVCLWTFKLLFKEALYLHWSHWLQSCWNSFMLSLFVNIHISICGGYVSTYITLLTIMLEFLHAWLFVNIHFIIWCDYLSTLLTIIYA